MNRKTPSIVGAAIGLALFLAIALLPARSTAATQA